MCLCDISTLPWQETLTYLIHISLVTASFQREAKEQDAKYSFYGMQMQDKKDAEYYIYIFA